MSNNKLIVIVGPTGVGKTKVALSVAAAMGSDIISVDSRQMFKYLSIGTAAPTAEEQNTVTHHFVQFLEPDAYYNAFQFEHDVMDLLPTLFEKNPVQVMAGGSMMYVDAVCKGIDYVPDVTPEVRQTLKQRYAESGLEPIREELKKLDPVIYNKVDLQNPARVIHALEVCLTTGKPYSSYLTDEDKERDFEIIKIGLNRPRPELYSRINQRVLQMQDEGLIDEVKSLQQYRGLQALQTVGYREVFPYLDGEYTLARAIELIQRNSRHYAKKQLTWFRKDEKTTWFHPDSIRKILKFLENPQ